MKFAVCADVHKDIMHDKEVDFIIQLGDDFKHVRYSDEVDENYPWIKNTVPYKDPNISDKEFILKPQ